MEANPITVKTSDEDVSVKHEDAAELDAQVEKAFSALIARFERNYARRRKWATIFRIFLGSYVAIVILLFAAWVVARLLGHKMSFPAGWIYSIYFANIVSGCFTIWMKWDSADILNSASDKRVIAPLIEIISLRNTRYGYGSKTVREAREALTRLLLDFQPSDEALLPAAHRSALANLAMKEDDGNLVNASIAVLSQIGRGESVRSLQALADWKGKYEGRDARDAAQQALVLVQERADRDKLHGALLRAAEGGADQEALLVRPALSPNATGASTLLQIPNQQAANHVSD